MRRKTPTPDALIRCIEECSSCAQVCTSCADASLAEDDVQDLRQSIRLCLDCADICNATCTVALAAQAPTRGSSGRCWTYAPQPAFHVARSIGVMLRTMST